MPRLTKASGLGGAAFAVAGLGMQIAFPDAPPEIGFALLLIALVLGTIWLTLILARPDHSDAVSGTVMHNPTINNYYASLDELSKITKVVEPQPKHASVQPNSSMHAHSSTSPKIVHGLKAESLTTGPPEIGSPTLAEHPPTFPEGLYVGMVIVSAGRLESTEHGLEIAVRAFNGTGKPLRFVYVKGVIKGGGGNLRNMPELLRPTWRTDVTPETIEPNSEFTIVVDQRVSPSTAEDFLQALQADHITLDLRDLNIMVEVADEPAKRARLPLWDGVTIRRRDDIFTGRNTIMGATGRAAGSSTATGHSE